MNRAPLKYVDFTPPPQQIFERVFDAVMAALADEFLSAMTSDQAARIAEAAGKKAVEVMQ